MISRTILRSLTSVLRRGSQQRALLTRPQYCFTRQIQKGGTNFAQNLQEEIQTEEGNLADLSTFQNKYKEQGWSISRENIQVELSKKVGKYQVRLISNIKSPANMEGQNEVQQQEQQEEGQDYNGEMNEITVCVTK